MTSPTATRESIRPGRLHRPGADGRTAGGRSTGGAGLRLRRGPDPRRQRGARDATASAGKGPLGRRQIVAGAQCRRRAGLALYEYVVDLAHRSARHVVAGRSAPPPSRCPGSELKGTTLGDDFTPYVKPGVLWWAFDPETAEWRGAGPKTAGVQKVDDPWTGEASDRAVVLLDEIDKADPDVPNNLLVPLGSLRFQVEETGKVVDTDKPMRRSCSSRPTMSVSSRKRSCADASK